MALLWRIVPAHIYITFCVAGSVFFFLNGTLSIFRCQANSDTAGRRWGCVASIRMFLGHSGLDVKGLIVILEIA